MPHQSLNIALAVADGLVLLLAIRHRLPGFALQRAVAVLSGYLYFRGPGHAWMGLSAAVPGLVELLAALEAVWLTCSILPELERYPARAFALLIGLLGWVVALLADPVPYPMAPVQWYGRTLLHVQETLMCCAAAAYVVHSAGVWRWQLAHVALMALYLGTDAWGNVQPATRWFHAEAVLMAIHLGCAVRWVVVLSLAPAGRAVPRSSDLLR